MNIIKSNDIEDILSFSLIPFEILTHLQKVELLNRYNFDIKKILQSNEKDLINLTGKNNLKNLNLGIYKEQAKFLLKNRVKFITADSNYFPFDCWKGDSDKNIDQCKLLPFLLFYDGDISLLNSKKISIVGTRKPNIISENFTHYIVNAIKRTVVSGFAMGIDHHAHLAALQSNIPTIAVFGCGTNIIYPKSNLMLYKKLISKDYLLLSEFPPDTLPKNYYFPIRNRIIAALSNELLCIQAGEKSGALITTEYAKKLNRRIFVFYPIDLAGFEGNLKLYNNNKAKLIYGFSKEKFYIKSKEILIEESDRLSDEVFFDSIDFSNLNNDLSNVEIELLKIIYKNPFNSLEYYTQILNLPIGEILKSFYQLLEKKYIIIDDLNHIYPDYLKNIFEII